MKSWMRVESHVPVRELQREVDHLRRQVQSLWCHILRIEEEEFVVATSFHSTQENPMQAFTPGSTIIVDFTPVPENATLTTPPTIVSSDNTNAPITVDPTGLIATINAPSDAVVGTAVTLTISYTNPDGTSATGAFSDTIVAAVVDVTGFTSAQTN